MRSAEISRALAHKAGTKSLIRCSTAKADRKVIPKKHALKGVAIEVQPGVSTWRLVFKLLKRDGSLAFIIKRWTTSFLRHSQ
ncbi:MAG: hypothetical protein AAFX87_01655 [Bacteroidota bacterium]